MNTLSNPTAPIKATCHCGAITVTVPGHPNQPINDCQCTICRRYGAAWAYYNPSTVNIEVQDGASLGKYVWGDRTASFNWCQRCGCLMFWAAEEGHDRGEMGVNSRMMEPDAVRGVNRKVDYGALFEPVGGAEGAK